MQSEPEDEKRGKEEVLESCVTEAFIPGAQRNKRPARCFFMTMAVIYLMLLIVAVVALASFEIKESEIRRLSIDTSQTCILFAPHEVVWGTSPFARGWYPRLLTKMNMVIGSYLRSSHLDYAFSCCGD